MAQHHEKAVKNAFTVGENAAVVSGPPSEGEGSPYKEPKRTWKSVVWSCKPVYLAMRADRATEDGILIALQHSMSPRMKPASSPSSI